LRVTISDSGPGIRPENRERVFEQFFQEEGSDGNGRCGLGLGLFLCRQIAERQGGRIWVETSPGGGATFAFTVPLTTPAQGAPR
jgi:signal transduction histidine kinase